MSAPAKYSPLGAGYARQEPDPLIHIDLEALVARARADEELARLLRQAWRLGWVAGFDEGLRPGLRVDNPFVPGGGWL